MKPFTRERAEAALRDPKSREKLEAFRRLPPNVDTALVTRAVIALYDDGDGKDLWLFARNCRVLPPAAIRGSLAAVAKVPGAEGVFLQEAVPLELSDGELVKAWARALQALLDLNHSAAWGSAIRKTKFKAIAADPTLLRAAQTAVVASDDPPLELLAVLAIDASEASVDALLPVFSKGAADTRLELLKVHATRNESMKAMLEAVTARQAKKEQASPAVAFVSRALELEKPLDSVKVMVWLSSEQTNRNKVPAYQGSLSIDSSWSAWWSVSLTRVTDAIDYKTTSFGADETRHDDLGLGGSTIEGLPHWLARAARKLKIRWRRGSASGSLRGKKRDQFAAWLFSEVS
jgi:hypothetical protein